MTPPLKKAIQNSLLVTAIVGLVIHLQGETVAAGIMTMIYSWLILFPSLYFTYRYTDRIRQTNAEFETTPKTTPQEKPSAESEKQSNTRN